MRRVYLALAFLVLASLACSTGSVPGLGPVESSPTPSLTPTATFTPTPTATPVVAPTRIPSPTLDYTNTPTLTPSFTPAPTLTPSFTPTDTPAPGSGSQQTDCQPPAGVFASLYNSDPALADALRCPLSQQAGVPAEAWVISSASQSFENGLMIWASQLAWQEREYIYVLFNDGTYRRYEDVWQDGVDPESGGEQPPSGRYEPVRGFGKIWRENPDVRAALGWALQTEQGTEGRIQLFEGGEMIALAALGQTYVFMQGPPMTWQVRATPLF
jgi:hypothetical protein